jgi:diacylglycerol kinase family enzyme
VRVDVFFNKLAGKADLGAIRAGVRRALFRCDVGFWEPCDVPDFHRMLRACLADLAESPLGQTDGIVLCGGDGTFNSALPPFVEALEAGVPLPPVSLIPVGTANDLAGEAGISREIDRAARALLEGTVRRVDILEVRDERGRKAYFATNGGLGIAAATTREVNRFKRSLRMLSGQGAASAAVPSLWGAARALGGGALSGLQNRLGARIYELGVVRELLRWNGTDWRVRVRLPGREPFVSRSPLLLISNQPAVGRHFVTAAFTRNNDGKFNFLSIEPTHPLAVPLAILEMRRGHAPSGPGVVRAEAASVELEAVRGSRKLLFFGDGEVLFENASRLAVRCIHPGVPLLERRR